LAFPAVAFITWPTKKPNSLSLPERYSATLSAFFARMSSIAASIAPVSVTWRRPLASTMAPGVLPV
jgi:hypothetical protein